jgi:hypothetical protein
LRAGEPCASLRKLSYDRRAVRRRFEERFTAARMAKDYVSTYRQLLKMRTSNGKTQSARPRQLALNGGNGLARVSIEKPIPGQFETSVHFSKSLRS